MKCHSHLLAAFAFVLPNILVTAQLTGTDVVFSEVFPAPAIGDRGAFIEIFNPTGKQLSLNGYKVCDIDQNICTFLTGNVPAAGYYTLCRDTSVYPFCNIATAIPISSLRSLLLFGPDKSVATDALEWSAPAPAGQSYARGVNPNNLLEFSFTTPTNGFGLLAETAPPSPKPTPMPTKKPTAAPVTPAPIVTPSPVTASPTTLCSRAFCHQRADCSEATGKAVCTCKTGFAGDGRFVCNDVDECSQNPDPCLGTGSFCVNEFGTFKCGCGKGAVDVNGVCFDINECENANACGANALCTDLVGGFSCACKAGYEGNPNTGCTDKNECTATPFPCVTNANCVNTDGSFTCTCKTGFQGDGTVSCSVTDKCTPNPCHPQATCKNVNGGFSCTCKTGFAGNGFSCVASPTTPPAITLKPTVSTTPSFISITPSVSPSISTEPSTSIMPSTTPRPSIVPSRSDMPSQTLFPSKSPSLSEKPSVTDMPSSEPSRKP